MKITKERIVEIIKEELADKASSVGGTNVKKLLQQNPAIEKLASAVGEKVEKLPMTSKALIAAAILQKMGFTDQDLEKIRNILPKLMATSQPESTNTPEEV